MILLLIDFTINHFYEIIQTGADLDELPGEYLTEELLTDEAAQKYARTMAGLREQEDDEPRWAILNDECHLKGGVTESFNQKVA